MCRYWWFCLKQIQKITWQILKWPFQMVENRYQMSEYHLIIHVLNDQRESLLYLGHLSKVWERMTLT